MRHPKASRLRKNSSRCHSESVSRRTKNPRSLLSSQPSRELPRSFAATRKGSHRSRVCVKTLIGSGGL